MYIYIYLGITLLTQGTANNINCNDTVVLNQKMQAI